MIDDEKKQEIIKFNNPSEAYLYGLAQSMKEMAKLGHPRTGQELSWREKVLSTIHSSAMEVIKTTKTGN